ncbi:MAG TPA: hypothetical protein VFF13_04315 [archaeon]|nr:hypothetical protein [archaeon]
MTFGNKISEIEERNKRVEADKAWETSKTRRFILALATYLIVLYFLISINAPNPYLNAAIPAGAYLIQQYSFPFLKKIWIEKIRKK